MASSQLQAMSHPAEAFFGMPRRLRLLFTVNKMTGVVQTKHGANYHGWQHPLSPYYRKKVGDEAPCTTYAARQGELPQLAGTRLWRKQRDPCGRNLGPSVQSSFQITARRGLRWRLGDERSMTARDFSLHVYPTFPLDQKTELLVGTLVEAANAAVSTLTEATENVRRNEGQRH